METKRTFTTPHEAEVDTTIRFVDNSSLGAKHINAVCTSIYTTNSFGWSICIETVYDVTRLLEHNRNVTGPEDFVDDYEVFFSEHIERVLEDAVIDTNVNKPIGGHIIRHVEYQLRRSCGYPFAIQRLEVIDKKVEEGEDHVEAAVKKLHEALNRLGYAAVIVSSKERGGESIENVEERLKRHI